MRPFQRLNTRMDSDDSNVDGAGENPLINSRTNSRASDCCHGNSIDEGEETAPPTRQLSTASDPLGVNSSPLGESPVRGRSYSCADAHENESLKLKVWELESSLEATISNRIVLKSLLQEACHSEWTHLETLRGRAEEDVVKAQRVVSGRGLVRGVVNGMGVVIKYWIVNVFN